MAKGFLMFKNKNLESFEKIIEESEIKDYVSYIKKNTGDKRIHYKFRGI